MKSKWISICRLRLSACAARALSRNRPNRSRHDRANRRAMIDRKSLSARQREAMRIEAHEVHDRGVDVGDVMAIFDRVEAELVGRAVDRAAFDAATRHEDREA